VLVDEVKMVGFAHLCPARDDDASPEVGEVTAIYLQPENWGRGAGRLLMDQALTALVEAGFSEAVLWVLDTNSRAQRFYRAGGWRADGTAKVDDRRGFPLREIRYRRTLLVPERPRLGQAESGGQRD
jgi:ribosomal protein S18 acetylase RimI-like enzyme